MIYLFNNHIVGVVGLQFKHFLASSVAGGYDGNVISIRTQVLPCLKLWMVFHILSSYYFLNILPLQNI